MGGYIGERVRMAAFHSLAERSAPLIQAIHSYHSLNKYPPPNLAALVPDFLPAIPNTGIGASPNYTYHVGKNAANYYGNPWVIVVYAPKDDKKFEEFLYFPLQNYPKHEYSNIVPISKWAYQYK